MSRHLERRGEDPRGGIPSYYDGYTDRRQRSGVVAFYVVRRGEVVRSRIDYLLLAAVIRAKLAEAGGGILAPWLAEVVPVAPASPWRAEVERYRKDPVAFAHEILGVQVPRFLWPLLRGRVPSHRM